MSTWNYRVTQQPVALSPGDFMYCIREVYYDDAGAIKSWSKDPMDPYGETLAELVSDVAHMMQALNQPVLDLSADGERLTEAT